MRQWHLQADAFGLDQDIPRTQAPTHIRTEEELARDFPLQRRDLVCPDCGDRLVLKDGKYGIFYGCVKWNETACKGAHNCHKQTAEPHGTPGNAKTRKARTEAHSWFDRLWKEAFFRDRDAAYEWLRKELGLSAEQCHVGRFDLATCEKVIRLSRQRLGDLTRFDRLEDDIL